MSKFKSFISFFPKIFEKATQEENLKEISSSMSESLFTSKMNGQFLTASEIEFVISELKNCVKSRLQINLGSEKSLLQMQQDNVVDQKHKIKDIQKVLKNL